MGAQNNIVVVYNYSCYGRGDRVFGMEAAKRCNVKIFRASPRASRWFSSWSRKKRVKRDCILTPIHSTRGAKWSESKAYLICGWDSMAKCIIAGKLCTSRNVPSNLNFVGRTSSRPGTRTCFSHGKRELILLFLLQTSYGACSLASADMVNGLEYGVQPLVSSYQTCSSHQHCLTNCSNAFCIVSPVLGLSGWTTLVSKKPLSTSCGRQRAPKDAKVVLMIVYVHLW